MSLCFSPLNVIPTQDPVFQNVPTIPNFKPQTQVPGAIVNYFWGALVRGALVKGALVKGALVKGTIVLRGNSLGGNCSKREGALVEGGKSPHADTGCHLTDIRNSSSIRFRSSSLDSRTSSFQVLPKFSTRGRPRRILVAAAAAIGVVEPVIVAPAVVEPVIAAPPVVAADHHDPQPAHICDICTINPKNKIFIPCGHTVCHQCAEQLERVARNLCFYCRTPVAQIFNYFP
ncbi:hypothetical protein OUZ56_026480 [Daphnia magna]|uniref:RING-type domain-containing protein n=1 Tax=Daphnia magna TaxID=35525 RepID=A0ABQ9ZM94_9CRUS|nr:hypothetical protein OUZ56_026480 [Daphnia magna]